MVVDQESSGSVNDTRPGPFSLVFSASFSIVDNESSPTIVVANENGGYVSVRPGKHQARGLGSRRLL